MFYKHTFPVCSVFLTNTYAGILTICVSGFTLFFSFFSFFHLVHSTKNYDRVSEKLLRSGLFSEWRI